MAKEIDKQLTDDFVGLARLALTGRKQDVQAFIRKIARRYRDLKSPLSESLMVLLRESPSRDSPLSPLRRQGATPIPVDLDSRLHLVRFEQPSDLDIEPIFSSNVESALEQVIAEHTKSESLMDAGLSPSRAILFVGPPGVGKTLSARWLAKRLEKPLLILDLSAVMSSYLGRTGANVRTVIDYAKSENCILFLDELDAVAKRRDDSTEIGELKRLVTVLLQEIDDWPVGSLLIAATNHPDLLDLAVWRRFDVVLDFPHPTEKTLTEAIRLFLGPDIRNAEEWVPILAVVLKGQSFSEVESGILRARRQSIINESPISDELQNLLQMHLSEMPKKDRIALGIVLNDIPGMSARRSSQLVKIDRRTLSKHQASSVKRREGRA